VIRKAPIQCLTRYEVVDNKTGKKVYDSGFKPSKSLVLQFLKVLEVQMGTTAVTVKDVNNVDRSCTRNAVNFVAIAVAGTTTQSILIGTGTTTETNADYQIETMINHGTGAGEMEYEAPAKTTAVINGAFVDYEYRRTFTNSSGNPITVQEAVYYGRFYSAGDYYACYFRETTGGVSVADGQTLSIKLLFRTAV